jgi:hypothetical protein
MQASQQILIRPQAGNGVYVADATALPWRNLNKPGLALKAIRQDDSRGHFLGLIGFDALTRSDLHQHQGVATSYVLQGSLHDYQGVVEQHLVGINRKGSTHDAMAYERTVLVSRSEAPVSYSPELVSLHGLHAGAHHAVFRNPDPSVPPDENVAIDALARQATGIDGLTRQTIFDYAGTGDDRRMLQMSIRPETRMVPLRTTALTEFWMRGGSLTINRTPVWANCFVIIEPDTVITLSCPFGALLLAWAEGPLLREDGGGEICGFE